MVASYRIHGWTLCRQQRHMRLWLHVCSGDRAHGAAIYLIFNVWMREWGGRIGIVVEGGSRTASSIGVEECPGGPEGGGVGKAYVVDLAREVPVIEGMKGRSLCR